MKDSLTNVEAKTFMDALSAISKIRLREWPESEPLYRFHESYESDISRIKLFCRKRAAFGHSSKYIADRWDIVSLLNRPYYFFYLPGTLLATLQFPERLGRLVFRQTTRDRDSLTLNERQAVDAVSRYLAVAGLLKKSKLSDLIELETVENL